MAYLIITTDGQHDVSGSDPRLLASRGKLPSQLQDLGSEVLQDSGQVDGSLPLVPVGHGVPA